MVYVRYKCGYELYVCVWEVREDGERKRESKEVEREEGERGERGGRDKGERRERRERGERKEREREESAQLRSERPSVCCVPLWQVGCLYI